MFKKKATTNCNYRVAYGSLALLVEYYRTVVFIKYFQIKFKSRSNEDTSSK